MGAASRWVFGISVGIFSKVIASLGLVLQKRWHTMNAALPIEKRKSWYTDVWWMAGFATYAAGNIIAIVALALIPQTVVASLDSLVLVFNAIWAPLLLGEHPAASDWGWNALIICGVALVVVYGPSGGSEHTGHELVELLYRPTYIIFASTASVMYLCAAWYGSAVRTPQETGMRRTVSRRRRAETPPPETPSPTNRGICSRLTERGPKTESPRQRAASSMQTPRLNSVYAVAVPQPAAAVAAGVAPSILSCFCLQLSKVVGELVGETMGGNNQFTDWPIYFFIGSLGAVNALQVKMLQAALNDFSALVIVPVFQVSLTVFAVIGGGIYFREFEEWQLEEGSGKIGVTLFSFGLALCITGVVFLSLRGSNMTDRVLRFCCCQDSEHTSQGTPTMPVASTPQREMTMRTDIGLANHSITSLRGESKLLVHSFVKVPWCEVNGPLGQVEESEDEEDEENIEVVLEAAEAKKGSETVDSEMAYLVNRNVSSRLPYANTPPP